MSKKFNDKTVILITIDALRADHLKSYGYTRNTAPYLEKYFERGMLNFTLFRWWIYPSTFTKEDFS